MAETYKLKHPNGFEVEVKTAARRDVLLSRGYKEGGGSSSKTTTSKTVKTSQGTKKQGNK